MEERERWCNIWIIRDFEKVSQREEKKANTWVFPKIKNKVYIEREYSESWLWTTYTKKYFSKITEL